MKIRVIRTMVSEFEWHPEYYPEGTTPEEAIKIDCDNVDGWENMFEGELVEDSVKGQYIDNNDTIVSEYIHSEFEAKNNE